MDNQTRLGAHVKTDQLCDWCKKQHNIGGIVPKERYLYQGHKELLCRSCAKEKRII